MIMDETIFRELIKQSHRCNQDDRYFLYDNNVCQIRCVSSNEKDSDFYLRSIESDYNDDPYTNVRLMDVNHNDIKMLVGQPITLGVL